MHSGEPVFVRAAPWHDAVGAIRHVRFRNVLACGESGAVVVGARPGLVEDVVLNGVRLEVRRTTPWPQRLDLRPYGDAGPEEEVVVPGVRVENAADVTLRDVEVVWSGERLDGFGSVVASRESPGLVLDDVRGSAARTGVPDLDVDSVALDTSRSP